VITKSSKSLGGQVVVVVAGDAINFIALIATAMILARIIPVEMMGTYRQVMYLAPMAVAMAEFGLSNTIYRYWNALGPGDRHTYLKMILIISFGLSFCASAALALLSGPLSSWYDNPLLKPALLISSLFPLATIPLMQLRPVLVCRGNPLEATLLELTFSLLGVIGLIIPLANGASFLVSVATWVIVLLFRLLAIPFVLGPDLFVPSKIWDISILLKIWEYEFPIQVGRIPGYVTENFDKVVMSLLFTTQEFAIYSMGAQELPFVGKIGFSVSNVLVPNLVEDVKAGRLDQINRRWRLACERTAMATYLIATFSIWYSTPVMQLIFSAKYAESSIPFRVFAALTFLRVIEYASLAKAFGRGDIIMKSSFLSATVLILLAFPLTYLFHGFGMALSFFMGTLAAVAYYLTHYRRWLNVPAAHFFPWPKLLLIGLFSVAGTGAAALFLEPMLQMGSDLSFISLAWKLGTLFAGAALVYAGLLNVSGLLGFRWPHTLRRRPDPSGLA
jgi:O-antigen/teichoic acid export membrane protein